MAWTTPRTWQAGELVTSTIMNTHVRDNLNALKDPPSDVLLPDLGANATLSSVTWTIIDTTNLSITITTTGGVVEVGFEGNFNYTAGAARNGFLDFSTDGTRQHSSQAEGIAFVPTQTTVSTHISFQCRVEGLSAGSHTFKMMWKNENAGDTFTWYAGAGTANRDGATEFWAIER